MDMQVKRVKRPTARSSARASTPARDERMPEPSHAQIAERAHDLYVRSGHQHGRDQEFWLEAERQLRESLREAGVN